MKFLSKTLETYPANVASSFPEDAWARVDWRSLRLGADRVWIISDQHLNHENIHEYCGRAEDWYKDVRSRWKHLVREEDLVLDLGDVIFHNPSQLDDYIKPLPGTKVLVRGNHDKQPTAWYRSRGYAFVCDQFTIGPVVFNHKPMSQLPEGIQLCVHGHMHNNGWGEEYLAVANINQLLSIEFEETPLLLKDFLTKHNRLT